MLGVVTIIQCIINVPKFCMFINFLERLVQKISTVGRSPLEGRSELRLMWSVS